MIVRRATPDDFGSIVALINRVFGLDRDLQWFLHFHLDNPRGQSVLWVAENDCGDIVSYRSIVRFLGDYRGQAIECGQLADACTDPALQGKGVYSRVNAAAQDDFFSSGGDLIVAFPSARNHSILTSKFGYREVASIRQGLCPLDAYPRKNMLTKVCNQGHRLVFRCGTLADRDTLIIPATDGLSLIRTASTDCQGLRFDRSTEYLRWRTSIPGRTYWIAVSDVHNHAIVGTARRSGLHVCTVADLVCDSHSARLRLLKRIRNWANENGYQGVYAWLDKDWVSHSLAGFLPTGRRTHLLVRFRDGFPLCDQLSSEEQWNLRLLDTDAY